MCLNATPCGDGNVARCRGFSSLRTFPVLSYPVRNTRRAARCDPTQEHRCRITLKPRRPRRRKSRLLPRSHRRSPAFIAPEADPQALARNNQYVLKSGDAFVVSDALGDIGGHDDGLFVDDMRVLSKWRLTSAVARRRCCRARPAPTTRRSPHT